MDEAVRSTATRTIPVLSLSRFEEDHRTLERILDGFPGTLYPNCRLRLIRCYDPAGALSILRNFRIPLVVCDSVTHSTGWDQVSKGLMGLPAPPCLILSSSAAAEYPAGEILKHGPYGVIPKPFCGSEVLRIINMAWRHWRDRYGLSAMAPQEGEPTAEPQPGPELEDSPINEGGAVRSTKE